MDASDQDAFDKARFATVLRTLKRDKIPAFASAVRYSGHLSTGFIDDPTTPQPVGCRLLSYITCGSFNAVFKVLFADGTLWVLKIPANGHRQCWDAPASEALTSEAFTMRLIRRETAIPVPEVFAFDASLENELGCPFILMELVYGKPLQDVWFAQGVSLAKREQIRIRCLHGIAEAMAQLNTLTFSQGGSLLFDTKGDVVGIGSSNTVDLETQYANMRSATCDNTMAFCQTGPFGDPRSYLLSLLDAREGKCERGVIEQGAYKLLRFFVEWSLMDVSNLEKPFVLAHPDLDCQNILVNDDGSLGGIIDWDGIAAVPHCIGSQSLPKFLTQDYDPANYAYDVEAGEPKEGFVADSPAELTCYRAMYAQYMESYLTKEDRVNSSKSRRHAARVRKSRKEAADMTRRSLVTSTLHVALKAPSEMKRLMVHLFDEIDELTAADYQEESSTADSEEQGDIEEGSKQDEDTDASEIDGGENAEEEPCVHDVLSKERAVINEHPSVDELMAELEKLMGVSLAGNSNGDIEQDPIDPGGTAQAEKNLTESEAGAHALGTVERAEETCEPRAARVCGWFKKKLQRGAQHLYKKPRKNEPTFSAALPPISRPTGAARTFCGWTEKRLRRLAHCLHCEDDDEAKAGIESKVEAVRIGAIDVLKVSQTKLMQLTHNLHCKDNMFSDTPEGAEEKASRNQQFSEVSRELTRADRRSVCGNFTQMIQDKKLRLTVEEQVAIAHWVIQTLQSPDFSETSLDYTRDHPHGKVEHHAGDGYRGNDDLGNDSGDEEGHEDGDQSSADGRDGSVYASETGHQDDGDYNARPMDRASMPQSSTHSLSAKSERLATGTTEMITDEEEPAEVPQEDRPMEEDTGAFFLLDVCIALAKDDLDERRMQRLQDGFFGLLNQNL